MTIVIVGAVSNADTRTRGPGCARQGAAADPAERWGR